MYYQYRTYAGTFYSKQVIDVTIQSPVVNYPLNTDTLINLSMHTSSLICFSKEPLLGDDLSYQ